MWHWAGTDNSWLQGMSIPISGRSFAALRACFASARSSTMMLGAYCARLAICALPDENPHRQASQYQGPDALDSILNYPTYNALVSAFAIPGPQNMSALMDKISQSQKMFKVSKVPQILSRRSTTFSQDTTLLGNFLEDQDVPRWGNLSVDPQSLYNAMVYSWMADGWVISIVINRRTSLMASDSIPIMYYGQEQGFTGNSDPYNREPLWPSGYANTTTYQLAAKLNQVAYYYCVVPTSVLISCVGRSSGTSSSTARATGRRHRWRCSRRASTVSVFGRATSSRSSRTLVLPCVNMSRSYRCDADGARCSSLRTLALPCTPLGPRLPPQLSESRPSRRACTALTADYTLYQHHLMPEVRGREQRHNLRGVHPGRSAGGVHAGPAAELVRRVWVHGT